MRRGTGCSTSVARAIERVVHTFFDGSTEGAMAALLESSGPLTPEMKRRLKGLIDQAEGEGR